MEVDNYHEIEFYYRIGQHSGGGSFSNFTNAYNEAEEFRKMDSKSKKLKDGLLYIGVSGDTDIFSIHHITKEYINHVKSTDMFSDNASKENWLKAAKLALKTNLPVIGSYK